MGGGEPIVRLPEQAGDVSIGTAAGSVTNNGADANRVLTMVELLVKNAWDADQRREVREAQEDAERRRRQNEVDYHREMTRQRLEKIADDVADLARVSAAHLAEVRRRILALTVAIFCIIGVVVAIVATMLQTL